MSPWLIAATALIVGLASCGWVCLRGRTMDRLVALELAGLSAALTTVLFAEGFERFALRPRSHAYAAFVCLDFGLRPLFGALVVSAAEVIVAVLLAAAVTVELLCCLGLLVMRTAFDRLHYLGPAATLGPVLLGTAVLVRHSSAQACIKIVLIVGLLLLINPVLTHATARATRIRQVGHLDLRDGEPERTS